MMRTREHVYDYLIQPSHLFLKQVIKVVETNAYIVVLDLRKTKNLFIPDKVLREFEYYLKIIKSQACKTNEYDGVSYLILPKK
jgi:predicted nucleic acid-binding protein